MKKYVLLIILTRLSAIESSTAQERRNPRQKPNPVRSANIQARPDRLSMMRYMVDENGDTVYFEELEEAIIIARRKGRKWRR